MYKKPEILAQTKCKSTFEIDKNTIDEAMQILSDVFEVKVNDRLWISQCEFQHKLYLTCS